jgi:hypothetical protein
MAKRKTVGGTSDCNVRSRVKGAATKFEGVVPWVFHDIDERTKASLFPFPYRRSFFFLERDFVGPASIRWIRNRQLLFVHSLLVLRILEQRKNKKTTERGSSVMFTFCTNSQSTFAETSEQIIGESRSRGLTRGQRMRISDFRFQI